MAKEYSLKNSTPASVRPKISIVMAAYNEEKDIGRALESILAQTYVDWELIVIDDGSTDTTADIVRSYAEKDSRIRFFNNETNLELSASLNKGIGLAEADLIARADADDINLPERLSRQYEYLQAHEEIDVLGTGAYLLDETSNRVSTYSYPLTHAELKGVDFLKSHFFHPSVMIRKRFFDRTGLYDPQYPNAEDKEIWLRGLGVDCCYANLPEPLIEYSTDGFVKSWKSIMKHSRSILRIAKNHKVKRGYRLALILIVYTAVIKLKIYSPKSIRQ